MSQFGRPEGVQRPQSQAIEYVNTVFIRGVFLWMTLGLVFTAAAAYMTLNNRALSELVFGNQIMFWGLIIAQFGLVMAISGAINRLSGATAVALFLLYSGLNGLTLSMIAVIYTGESIAQAFVSAAATFGVMSVYGYVTKKDLTSIGSMAFMALIGIIIASLINVFFFSNAIASLVINILGVLIFVALTAYDVQKIRQMGEALNHNDANAVQKGMILGALTLYLDFINLFLFLLRIFGDRRS
ncbi:Bax inhibitor-1/YccA family protein [Desulfovibrio litoralis]|uniref:Modulator of FtsH protease n=1 Tax=Desulfovibrio litoralis DSM 11393 TaxID=1121455 RepID=A0A1M7SMF6_9BACT|nr:Bax inhibitor-1/YccA family protein [Desulfovibrio litoralis]SHN59655.1 hypothetical protein SAMN02745728_01036 [Desulfovibrio litoralis DSM 11393]